LLTTGLEDRMLHFDPRDLVEPTRYAERGRPYELFAALRREAPVAYCEPEGYAPFWAITRHEDIVAISRDPARFSNAEGVALLRKDEPDFQRMVRTIVNMDPPDHGPYRAIGHRWFVPRNLRSLEERVRDLVHELLDGVAARGATRIDFVSEIATPLPLRMICNLLGLPPEDEAFALRVADEAFGADDPDMKRSEGGRQALVVELFGYFTKMLADRRREPREDLLSLIANAEVNGKPIPDLEALSYAGVILGAGIDTTRNALGSGLETLLAHPEQLERLRKDPSLVPTAVEEILRWTVPANQMLRSATCDTEVRGVAIRKGETLVLFYPSANRDESVFDEPDRFLVDRKPNHHLTFGIGEHFCLGAGLARMEIRVLLEELLPRLRSIRLAGTPKRIETNFIVGWKELPIELELDAAKAPGAAAG
jgi:cytochrome P450